MARPWYKWFPSNWLSSETRLRMNTAERAIYRDLLDVCYQEGSIPSDERSLAGLAAVPLADFRKAWPEVSKKFISVGNDRLSNEKCIAELSRCADVVAEKSVAGRNGGLKSGEARRRSKNEANASNVLPISAKQKRSDADADADADKNNAKAPISDSLVDAFERWIAEYPNPVRIDTALRSWISLISAGEITEATLPDLFAGLKRWKDSRSWADEDGKFIPAPAVFLTGNEKHTGRMWKDRPPASAEAKIEKRGAQRSSEGVDPNAEWVPSWKAESA